MTLQDLIASAIPEIATAAQKTQQYADEFKAGRISRNEYNDLLQDITRLDKINKDMFTLDVYMEITKAFQYLSTLKSLASLL